uniref:Uncharacterized protein n=1 Tax=Meloidogyne enterolobii TaxID=390850 RepID=A0A6V7X1X6_MELEN|nr:unnamed protein product [Meloidogyne enterolobii]
MHAKSPNMRIYMHQKSPKYAPKYAKFAKICTKYAAKNSENPLKLQFRSISKRFYGF